MRFIGIILLLSIIVSLLIFTNIRGENYAIMAICICILYIYSYETIIKLNPNKECLIGSQKKPQGLLSGGCIDVWHVQHILFWIIIGILWPGHILTVIFVSVSWEILEHIYFKYTRKTCQDVFCGRYEDILSNLIGYLIGSYLLSAYK